jgi:citronellol/citronellal dehydrogenase
MNRLEVISRHLDAPNRPLLSEAITRELCGWVLVNVTREDAVNPKHSLKGKTIFITGGSRGIGLAIALAAAREGANIVLAAKTTEPQPNLEGTIYTAATEVEKAGGKALAVKCDVRDEKSVEDAVKLAVDTFGGLDILVNNASAISMTGTLETTMKKYDLLHSVDGRATFLVSQKCIPHLLESAKRGRNPHILMISPPLDMDQRWFLNHTAYTAAKMTMSMHVLGMSGEVSVSFSSIADTNSNISLRIAVSL